MKAQPTMFEKTRQGVRNLDSLDGPFIPASVGPMSKPSDGTNVGQDERAASLVAGGLMLGASLIQPSIGKLLMGAIGAALVHRGVSGNCQLYSMLGVNTAKSKPSSAELVYR